MSGADTKGFAGGPDALPEERLLQLWEDVLTLVVDPKSAKLREPELSRRLLSRQLEEAGIDRASFMDMDRNRRAQLFRERFSRVSRGVPELGLTRFDLDRALGERSRGEPLTLGAGWPHGPWRSSFSPAGVTHPAMDGARTGCSTVWDILRKEPAGILKDAGGRKWVDSGRVTLGLPLLVGPFRHTDGETLERAYLRAIDASGAASGIRTLVGVDATGAPAPKLTPFAAHLLPRFAPDELERLLATEQGPWQELMPAVRILEMSWHPDVAQSAARVLERWPHLLLSIHLRYSGGFWAALEESAEIPGVALIQLHAAETQPHRLLPRADEFLKNRRQRTRVQLVNTGGDDETLASAAAVYESILLGANAGAITDLAAMTLAPELIDVACGPDAGPVIASLGARDEETLFEWAKNSLSCWRQSILALLSCMGIDDIRKTAGNSTAITVTADWVREIDALATPEFAEQNRALNRRRIEAAPVPPGAELRYRVSSLITELSPPLPLAQAARVLEQKTAVWHLHDRSRSLGGDHLAALYRMAAGVLPEPDDFLLERGAETRDGIRLRLSRQSVEWACDRLRRDPALLDYIRLAVPKGMSRPGAVAPHADCELRTAGSGTDAPLARWKADERGGFEVRLTDAQRIEGAINRGAQLEVVAGGGEGEEPRALALDDEAHGAAGVSVCRASRDGRVVLKTHPDGGYLLSGHGVRAPIWQSPVSHGGISHGVASDDFLAARLEGNRGLAAVSSGEGGPLRLHGDLEWESVQAASAHFGIHAGDARSARDVEIKISQGARPGLPARLAEVSPQVSRARNVSAGTDAVSPAAKADLHSLEDLPAEVQLWLLYNNYCGVKIAASPHTRFVAASTWSNSLVDYLQIDAGQAGTDTLPADASRLGWSDLVRSILHTHHDLLSQPDGAEFRDANGAGSGAVGGTRLIAGGGIRDEVDMVKALCAGADGVTVGSIDKAVGFGCNQCGYCHLGCPRGGLATGPELTSQNDRETMRRRFRNWSVLNLVKLAVLIDALNRESGALDESGKKTDPSLLIEDVRALRGRVDLLEFPERSDGAVRRQTASPEATAERDSCRIGALAVTRPVDVSAAWEAARVARQGGNNRGGGLAFAGFAPPAVAGKTCLMLNSLGPDRAETIRQMLEHFSGCRFHDAAGRGIPRHEIVTESFRLPVQSRYADEGGWRRLGLREDPGDFYLFFVDLEPEALGDYARQLTTSPDWLQRRTLFGDRSDEELLDVAYRAATGALPADEREAEFLRAVHEEYLSVLCHILDRRFYRTRHATDSPAGKHATARRGHVVSCGENLAAIKIAGWTHRIPEYFDLDAFWSRYPGADGGVEIESHGERIRTTKLLATLWGMHHRYPAHAPEIDDDGRGSPAGAHPFRAYNLLLLHNGDMINAAAAAPLLAEQGHVHVDASMGPGAEDHAGDSLYRPWVGTDTEYAVHLVDFTRRVLGLSTEGASQILSPLGDLERLGESGRELYRNLSAHYAQLSPAGPYLLTLIENDAGRLGLRVVVDPAALRPHEIVVQKDVGPGGVSVAATGSEARVADAMVRTLRRQAVIPDGGSDLRFHTPPGGAPGEPGGVTEITLRSDALTLHNRFGEEIAVERFGQKPGRPDTTSAPGKGEDRAAWRAHVDRALADAAEMARRDARRAAEQGTAVYGPESALPIAAADLVAGTLERLAGISYDDYRHLVELALPTLAASGDPERAVALRVLTELRKRLVFSDAGGKSLSSLEYLAEGGRAPDGSADGGIYRILDAVPGFLEGHGRSRYLRLTHGTRDDLFAPADPVGDVLVIDFRGFTGWGFDNRCASRLVSAAVRLGWRRIIGYDFTEGPYHVGTNLAWPGGEPARGVEIELYGRAHGDYLAALLEGARVYLYGQAQSHAAMKADSGRLFVLEDALHNCAYAAHGGTISAWDTGARFAIAAQNKRYLDDGISPASGLKTVHMGSPGEFAFEYLMSGGDNSCHLVLGLAKPDARGRLRLRPRPHAGRFLLAGATAGRLLLLDPGRALHRDPGDNCEIAPVTREEWERDAMPLINGEAWLRGAPMRAEPDGFALLLDGEWRRWSFEEAFVKLVPRTRAATEEMVGG